MRYRNAAFGRAGTGTSRSFSLPAVASMRALASAAAHETGARALNAATTSASESASSYEPRGAAAYNATRRILYNILCSMISFLVTVLVSHGDNAARAASTVRFR